MNPSLSFIGSGNVATHLAQAFTKNGFKINEIYSRQLDHAKQLVQHVQQGIATSSLDLSNSNASIFIIAISDDAIEQVVQHLKIPEGRFIVHTSGSVSLSVLEKFTNRGIFYPVQTFSKNKNISFENCPVAIEASNNELFFALENLAHQIGAETYALTSEQRQVLHLAAVISCNFSNHLYAIAYEVMSKKNLSFELLKPLIQETVDKAFQLPPHLAQTGPAIRNDKKIISQHLDYLRNEPELYTLYNLFSDRIAASAHRKQSNEKDHD